MTAQPRDAFGETRADGIFVSNETLARWSGTANGVATADEVIKARRKFRMAMADERDQKPILGPTEKPAPVRIATPDDEQAILALLLMDLKENNLDKFQPIDEARVLEHVRLATQRKGGIVGVIDGPEQRPVACTILLPSKFWWTRAQHYTDIVTFVHPEHRRSRHAHDLIQFQKWVGDAFTQEFGYRVYVLMSVIASKKAKEKVRLFRRFVTQVGGYFVYPAPVVENHK